MTFNFKWTKNNGTYNNFVFKYVYILNFFSNVNYPIFIKCHWLCLFGLFISKLKSGPLINCILYGDGVLGRKSIFWRGLRHISLYAVLFYRFCHVQNIHEIRTLLASRQLIDVLLPNTATTARKWNGFVFQVSITNF